MKNQIALTIANQLGTVEVCLDYSYFTFKKSVLATTLKRENSKE